MGALRISGSSSLLWSSTARICRRLIIVFGEEVDDDVLPAFNQYTTKINTIMLTTKIMILEDT
jgi:hypothetical protein